MTADQLLRQEFNGYVRAAFGHRRGHEYWLGFPTKFYCNQEMRKHISVLKDIVLIRAMRRARTR